MGEKIEETEAKAKMYSEQLIQMEVESAQVLAQGLRIADEESECERLEAELQELDMELIGLEAEEKKQDERLRMVDQ